MQRTAETDLLEPLEPQHNIFLIPNQYETKVEKVSKSCLYVSFILHSPHSRLTSLNGLVAVLQ